MPVTPVITYDAIRVTDTEFTLPNQPIIWVRVTNNAFSPVKLFSGKITLANGQFREFGQTSDKTAYIALALELMKNTPTDQVDITIEYCYSDGSK